MILFCIPNKHKNLSNFSPSLMYDKQHAYSISGMYLFVFLSAEAEVLAWLYP